ncbi:CGNR zinc finger domain-containing protein [Salinispora cortesiana]|uniref:CGNR zinc finger domain-containing protein n=1 Tax=Salinispora cortesiana TaxID=1305843 RepID=UPI000471D8FC|nr:CGNR zinc finger domain-containing protein [Salinispora cortesiana]
MQAQLRAHTFQPRDLVGGDLVLDLVNTVTTRNAEPVDWLDGYARLLDWAELTGAFPAADLAQLLSETAAHPRAAECALAHVKTLRESLCELLTATVFGQTPPPGALASLQTQWRRAVGSACLQPVDEHITPAVTVEASGFDYLTHALALHAVRLLEDVPLSRLRVCAGRQCGWFYLDTSKAGRRRWCDMATCGNAEKTRRHDARR